MPIWMICSNKGLTSQILAKSPAQRLFERIRRGTSQYLLGNPLTPQFPVSVRHRYPLSTVHVGSRLRTFPIDVQHGQTALNAL